MLLTHFICCKLFEIDVGQETLNSVHLRLKFCEFFEETNSFFFTELLVTYAAKLNDLELELYLTKRRPEEDLNISPKNLTI